MKLNKKIGLMIMTVIVAGVGLFFHRENTLQQEAMQQSIAGKILRFHVLANSDSDEDQALKKQVRDAIGAYMEPYLEESDSIEMTRAIVSQRMEEIVETAEQTIASRGYDYPVEAQLTHTDFPVKTYGDYTFPAGEYEALEVTIGEGAGHNWWCVLYPNMCFRGSVYEVVEKDAKEALQEVLSAEEYADIFNNGNVEIRLRFLDLFK